jgi:hypothetical protein
METGDWGPRVRKESGNDDFKFFYMYLYILIKNVINSIFNIFFCPC